MIEQKFIIADRSPCFHCGEPLMLESSVCVSCNKENPARCTAEDIYLLFYEGNIIDARAGGLILGRNHNEDDIPMFAPVAPGVFQIVGLMQGGEFIVNSTATSKHLSRVEEINAYKINTYTPMDSLSINEYSRVFNTNGLNGDLSLLVNSGSYIINRAATIKHYQELVAINNGL